ncbi:MAG: hypothetical protein ABIN80_13730 [Dyadobacter sp.]|uniref:hypothetical protein n=1 Tax=Dyadobacter sp. TaxID=1914288 RepID=UPI003264B923
MEAENIIARKRKIQSFAAVYSGLILLSLFFCYWGFIKVPKTYHEDRVIRTSQLTDFLKQTQEVKQLTLQIQDSPDVKQSSVVAYYEWVNKLKSNYSSKIFVNVLDSYLKQTDDTQNRRNKDTTLVSLEKTYITIKGQNEQLLAENLRLQAELSEKKAQTK